VGPGDRLGVVRMIAAAAGMRVSRPPKKGGLM